MSEEKKALRRKLKEIRNSIPEELRKDYSAKILLNLDKIDEYRNAERVMLFANAGSEVFTDDIFLSCIQNGKSVYYPKVVGEDMVFVKVSDLDELVPAYRGIREPAGILTGSDTLSSAVIICPGLGFTKNGERIGYGGGFYDRFISKHTGLYRIGVCFEDQICDHIPVEENDFRMHSVVTEADIY